MYVYFEDFASNNIVLVYYIGVIGYLGFESYDSYKNEKNLYKTIDKEFPIIKFYFFKTYLSKIIFQTIHLVILLCPFLLISFNIISKDHIFQNTFLLSAGLYYFILFSQVIPNYYNANAIEKKIHNKIVK